MYLFVFVFVVYCYCGLGLMYGVWYWHWHLKNKTKTSTLRLGPQHRHCRIKLYKVCAYYQAERPPTGGGILIHSISRRIIGFAVCPVKNHLFVSAQLSNTHNDNSRIKNAIRNSAFLSISYHLFKIMLPFQFFSIYELLGLL